MRLTLGFLFAIGALPTQAEQVLDVEAFEQNVTGSTITYWAQGSHYGVEEYRPNRRVVWIYGADECRFGTYFQRDQFICFTYDHDPDRVECWTFADGPAGLTTLSETGGTFLNEFSRNTTPLKCTDPYLGV